MIAAELLLGFRWMLGAVFATAGARKIAAGRAFEQSLASYGVVPEFLHLPFARLLPIVEIVLGTAFMLGALPLVAGWSALVLLLGFACAVAWNLFRGKRFECGCGMVGDGAIRWSLVLRDLGLAAIAAAVALGPSGSLAVWRGSAALPVHTLATAELIPVPMIAILALAVIHAFVTGRSAWKGYALLGRPGADRETQPPSAASVFGPVRGR